MISLTLQQLHALFTRPELTSSAHSEPSFNNHRERLLCRTIPKSLGGYPLYVTSFQKLRIYLVILPGFVIYFPSNVAKNLSKNRRLSAIGVPLTVVVGSVIVEPNFTSTTVADWITIITTIWKPGLKFLSFMLYSQILWYHKNKNKQKISGYSEK